MGRKILKRVNIFISVKYNEINIYHSDGKNMFPKQNGINIRLKNDTKAF